MKACIVPPNPGNLSAFGLFAVDWRTDHIVTKVMHEDAIDLATVADIYAGLETDAATTLERDGIERSRIRLVREADVRYAGQSMEVRVPAPSGPVGGAFIEGLVAAFHAAHLKTFGYNYAGQQKVEFVNFSVSGFGMIDRPSIPELATSARRRHRSAAPSGVFRPRLPRHAGVPAGCSRRVSASTDRQSSRNSVPRPWFFPTSILKSMPTAS